MATFVTDFGSIQALLLIQGGQKYMIFRNNIYFSANIHGILVKKYVSPKSLGTFPGCSPYFFEPPGGPGAAGGRQNHVFFNFL